MPAYTRVPLHAAVLLMDDDVAALREAGTQEKWYVLAARLWKQAEPDAYRLFRESLEKMVPPPEDAADR